MAGLTDLDLSAEHVDAVVKNFALKEFKMLPLCKIIPTSADKNTYYDETDSDLTKTVTTGITATSLSKSPRGAQFNAVHPSWTKVSEYPSKHTAKAVILWEDTLVDALPVVARTLLRVTRAVGNSLDTVIITELNTTTNTSAASNTWDNADVSLQNPIYDLLTAIEGMEIDNWDVLANDGFVVMHPTNKKELLANSSVRNSGQFYTSAVTENGKIERICGLRIVSTTSQTANTVTLGISQVAIAFYQVSPLKTDTVIRAGLDYAISAWVYGVPALINNNAAYKLTGC